MPYVYIYFKSVLLELLPAVITTRVASFDSPPGLFTKHLYLSAVISSIKFESSPSLTNEKHFIHSFFLAWSVFSCIFPFLALYAERVLFNLTLISCIHIYSLVIKKNKCRKKQQIKHILAAQVLFFIICSLE